jgi:pullulanase/glycogen debranching enzyme
MLAPGAEDLLLLLNAHDDRIEFALPGSWRLLLDTSGEGKTAGEAYPLEGRSLALLVTARRTGPAPADA